MIQRGPLSIGLALSVGLHLGIQHGLASQAQPKEPPETTMVVELVARSLEDEAPPPVEAPPTPSVEEVPAARRVPVTLPVNQAPPAEEPEKAALEDSVDSEEGPTDGLPIDLSAMTLGNAAGSWTLSGGGGRRGRRPRRAAGHAAPSSTPAPRRQPETVALRDLSTRPTPPALGVSLERFYPPEARRQGLAGKAVVQARVEADGGVSQVRVVEASAPIFGVACKKALEGSRWSAPRDMQGRAVATSVLYTCEFEVRSSL